jgi:hypothetical protein
MRKPVVIRTLSSAVVAVALAAVPAQAQTAGAYSDLPDTFRIDAGGFRIAADTKLTYSLGGAPASEVDFENEVGLPGNATTLWLDGTWRAGRRHQLSLNFTRSNRTGEGTTLTRDITWGDQVLKAGVTVESEGSANIVSGYYRFAIVRNDRFEIGPAIGVGHLSVDFTLRATSTVSAGGGSTSRSTSTTGQTGSITGDVGAYFTGWITRRVVMRGDLLYILVKPGNSEASVTDGRLGLYYYPFRNVGLGAQYKYYKYRYDRALLSASLGGTLVYQGAQVFVSFLF